MHSLMLPMALERTNDALAVMTLLFASGVTLSLLTRRHLLLRQISGGMAVSGTEQARLAELWKGGIEIMLQVPPGMEDLVLKPCSTDAESRLSFEMMNGPPFALAFALTAFDPPGVERSRTENAAENAKLWPLLKALEPAAAWRGYGCDFGEGWREDGFILQFDPAARESARQKVLAVAVSFDQGAIYEYRRTADGALRRRTVGAKLQQIDEETPMQRVESETFKSHELMRLPWAGPPDGGIL